MKFKYIPLVAILLLSGSVTPAQKTEITISFSEQFFDALLDAVFQYAEPPEFSLASSGSKESPSSVSFVDASLTTNAPCNESVKLLRENAGTRTSVKFREGKIIAPLAFTGKYSPPLIGCVGFTGTAESVITLEFDQANQRLIARAKVRDVSLNGTGGIGGSLVAKMVQGTIDKKINPIEIIRTDKVTFVLPVQNSGQVRMKANGFTSDLANGLLNVHVLYEFQKAN
ncbi:MAG TPA: hypothetical protein VJV05_00495 [Pyrinomonadaceae bacterium]|nr:hypothetical protein [Pyrinomonadaceae bacterium]